MAVGILDLVQVFDQHVGRSRSFAKQRCDLGSRDGIDRAALGFTLPVSQLLLELLGTNGCVDNLILRHALNPNYVIPIPCLQQHQDLPLAIVGDVASVTLDPIFIDLCKSAWQLRERFKHQAQER